MIFCFNNIPLFCIAEISESKEDEDEKNNNNEVFLERDQEVISDNRMDSRIGLDYIVENSDYVSKLASALDTNNEIVKKQVFELLSALCAYSRSGYSRAIETLENYKVIIFFFFFTSFATFVCYYCILSKEDNHNRLFFSLLIHTES